MKYLFKEIETVVGDVYSGNLCIKYDSNDNREIVDVILNETTPNLALSVRNQLLSASCGVLCFDGADVRLENDFEWEGNDKTYSLIHIECYLCEDMLDYYEGKISYFNGKITEY